MGNRVWTAGRLRAFICLSTLLAACGGGGGGGGSPPPPPLSLPASATVDAGTSRTVQASGGQTPYQYQLVSGGGTIDATSGVFMAPATAGTSVVRVTDHAGATAQESLTINPPFAAVTTTFTIGAGTTQAVSATGGQTPYAYGVRSGGGTVDGSGRYTAPATPGSAVVTITDALGTTVEVSFTINPALSVTPSSATLTASSGASLPFLAQNGVPPYSYALTAGPGALTAQGVYTVGAASGVATVQVTDSQGISVTATVRAPRIRVNGAVFATASDGTSLYVGGRFSAVNPHSAPHLLIADQVSGNPELGCDLGSGFLDGTVSAVVTSGNSIYIGGSFNLYNGRIVGKLAKIDATTCALDTTFSRAGGLGSQPGFSIYALALSGNTLYVAGNFNSYRGAPAAALLKLDATTGDADPAFAPGSGPDVGGLAAVTATASAVYVGGYFSHFSGTTAHYIAKLDPATGAIDPVFALAPGADGPVQVLASAGTAVYAAGAFTHYAGVATGLARVDGVTGALDTAFSQNVANYSSVAAILPAGSSVYVGGGTNSGNTPALAKIDAITGVTDATFTQVAGFNFGVDALALVGSSLYVGGGFTSYNGAPAYNLAKLDATSGALDTTFTQATGGNQGVSAVAAVGSLVVAGGALSTYRGQPAGNVAKFDVGTSAVDSAFTTASGTDGNVLALALNAGSLYVGGYFTHYHGVTANYLAKVDAATGVLDATFAQAGGPGLAVFTMLPSGGSLYVGGSAASPGPGRLAKVDLVTGHTDPAFTAGGVPDGSVTALAALGSALYVGGQFQNYGSVPARNLAKVDATTGAVDQAFTQSSGAGGGSEYVLALLPSGGALYVAGYLASYRGTPVQGLVKIDATSGALDATFTHPDGLGGTGQALVAGGGALYVAGNFSSYRSLPASNVVKLDAVTGNSDAAFANPGACDSCRVNFDTLTLVGSRLYVGGDDATFYRRVPVYHVFPVDGASGAPTDP